MSVTVYGLIMNSKVKGWEYPIEPARPYYVLTSLTFIVIQLTFKGKFSLTKFFRERKRLSKVVVNFLSPTPGYI